ncbi:lipopolysaccharide assembly protein LapB [Anoxybacillus sp. PDR2]|uniref:tetratricopeptide repeat protein n=1 Tax=Anoxybacillus sp. PDR2 TaxID=1636720 RepID=UPI001F1598CE|nr:CDC27 family protein [Anoxybacillus sp. PDR2]
MYVDISLLLKGLASAFFTFTIPKLKNLKAVRDFKDKWIKDNYSQKITLMFQAGVDDAKAILDLPDEVIKDLLEDKINRQEIFRWIIEGTSDDAFKPDHFFLDPYFEKYPQHQDKLLPFFQLILLKINEYKEKNWDPEFQNILHGMERIREELRTGFERLEKQNERNMNQIQENIQSTILNALGPVGYDDLKELLEKEKVITARKKAEERIKHAHSNEEKLELNALIANSYMCSGNENEAIPYLYAAISYCQDEPRKNRLYALIKIIEDKLDEALVYVNKNITLEGYTPKNIELLLNIYFLQKDYEKCLSLLEKHGDTGVRELKARILLFINKFDQVLNLTNEELNQNPLSKEWMLLKAEAHVLQLEHLISKGMLVNHEETFKLVIPLLEKIGEENENRRHLRRVKELYAALYFRTRRFKEAALCYEELYKLTSDDKKDSYFQNLIWSYYLCKEWENVIDSLENKIKDSNCVEHVTLLARSYMESGNPKNALQTLNDYEDLIEVDEDLPIEYYFVKLEVLYRLFKHKEIISFIKEVEEKGQDHLKAVIKGYYAILQDDWDTAISNFEYAVNHWEGRNLLEIKIQLVDAYRKKGTFDDYQKLTELIPTIPHWIHHELFVNTYTLSLYKLGQYDKIISLYYNELKEPTVFVQDIVASIFFQSDWYEISKEMYEKLFHQTEDIKFLFRYSSCLFRLGDTEGCLNTLKLAEKKVSENASIEDLQLLTFAYLDAMEYEKALEYAYQTFKYGEKNPDVWRAYFGQFVEITQMLEKPKQEHVDAFHKVMKEFHETFPEEEKLFEQYQVIENGQLSKDFLSRLESLQTSQKEVEDLFVKYRLPLQIFCDLMQGKPNLTWGHVATQEKLHFWAYETGNIEEVQKGLQCVLSSKNILCDIFSILTLDYLGLLEHLSKEFRVYIFQEQFSSLFFEYSQLKLSRYKGLTSISYANGRIIAHEWTSKEVEESLAKMEKLIKWINENGRKVGKALINPSNKQEKNFFDDQLQLCKDSLFTMIVDSFIVNKYAKSQYKINTFTVVDFVNYLLLKGVLDKETYYETIGKLIMIGYRYITAKADVFIYFLRKNQFNLEGEVEWLFRYLREEEVNREYVFSIVLEILDWLSEEQMENVEQLLEYLCDVLVGEEKNIEWLDKLFLMCEKVFKGNDEYLKRLKKVLEKKIAGE